MRVLHHLWDLGLADRAIEKVISNNSGAAFFFGLFDDDVDPDDLMGHVSVVSSAGGTGTEWSHTGSVLSAICGDAVEGIGWTNNYRLHFSIWFTDSDGPLPLSAPIAWDNGVPATVDDDQRLDFTWDLTSDPNSGIAGYSASLISQTSGVIFANVPVPAGSVSICASGCDLSYVPLPGHRYDLAVKARNGALPQLENQIAILRPSPRSWSPTWSRSRSLPPSFCSRRPRPTPPPPAPRSPIRCPPPGPLASR